MAYHVIDFLKNEVKAGRLPKNLLPLQSGVGSVANAVLAGLNDSGFSNLTFFSEVIQDSALELLDAGKLTVCSATAIAPSQEGLECFKQNIADYRKKIILRPQEISNNPEVIRRLGIISMNTAIEVDIYGNVNSTHIMGTQMMNGIGGSSDFTRNAYLSMIMTPSIAKQGDVSSIVPMCSHIDHTEHDVHVIVTEMGVADLRNKSPRERAVEIINHCAHPKYKDMLLNYYEQAIKKSSINGYHTPHLLTEAPSWHQRYLETGTMEKLIKQSNKGGTCYYEHH